MDFKKVLFLMSFFILYLGGMLGFYDVKAFYTEQNYKLGHFVSNSALPIFVIINRIQLAALI